MKTLFEGWSLDFGRVRGVPLRVHVSTVIGLAWIGSLTDESTQHARVVVICAALVALLVHEAGHLLTAFMLGVRHRRITVFPFGAVPVYSSVGSATRRLAIAIAGPLVSIIAAVGIEWYSGPGLSAGISGLASRMMTRAAAPQTFLDWLLLSNLTLGLVNLIPAAPMDAGRAFRELLEIFGSRASMWAVGRLSQGMCLTLAIWGALDQKPVVLALAFILFFGALGEYLRGEAAGIATAFKVDDVMIPTARLMTFTHATTISRALSQVLVSVQPVYPVTNHDQIMGLVFREEILRAAATEPEGYISSLVVRDVPAVSLGSSLGVAYEKLEVSGSPILQVTHEDTICGIVLDYLVNDFLLMSGLRASSSNDDDVTWSAPL